MTRFVDIPGEFETVLEYWASLGWYAAQKQILEQNLPNFTLQKAGLNRIDGTIENPVFIEKPWLPAQEKAATWLVYGTGPYRDTELEESVDILKVLAGVGVEQAQKYIARAIFQRGLTFSRMKIGDRHKELERLFLEEKWGSAGPYLYNMWNSRQQTGLILPKRYHHTLAKLGVEKAQRKLDSGLEKAQAFKLVSKLWSVVDELL
ncbi:MAG: hypothetical protein GY915_06515 [bacterium]|nr:hypothetical protein [bacterium]